MGFRNIPRTLAVAVAGLLAVTLAHSDAPPERLIRFRLHGEPTTLDWNIAHTPYEIYLLMNLMEGLVRLPANLKPAPALAESWKVLEEGKKYVFKLKPGVKWSDGVPLKAQHFVDSWRRLLTPSTAAPYAYFLFDVVGAADFHAGRLTDFAQVGVKAIDDATLEVRLKHAVSHWIQLPSFWLCFPIRSDLIQKHGVGWERPGKLVTLGPFVLSQYDEGKSYTLVANPLYHGGAPQVDRLVGEIIEKPEEALEKFKQGKLEVVTQLGAAAFAAEADASLSRNLRKDRYLRTLYLGMSTARFPMQKLELRRAIAAAIPRSEFLKEELMGGQAATSFVPPGLVGHDPQGGMPFNLDQARRDLRKSGLSLTTMPELELMTVDHPTSVELAKWVAARLRTHLGLRVRVNELPLKAFMVRRELQSAELFISSWAADFPDADNFLTVFQSTSGNNHSGWKSKEYDAELESGRKAKKDSERAAAYLRAQKRLQVDEVVMVPLYYDVNESLIAESVQGVEITPLNQVFFRKAKVQSSKSSHSSEGTQGIPSSP
jgi:oligopeptide transport system substrate-binding protein